jgi:hypothetical protein
MKYAYVFHYMLLLQEPMIIYDVYLVYLQIFTWWLIDRGILSNVQYRESYHNTYSIVGALTEQAAFAASCQIRIADDRQRMKKFFG